MSDRHFSRTGRIAFALIFLSTVSAAAQQVTLTVDLGKATFFEDEPIYALIEMKNLESDTLWVELFGLAYRSLTAHLSRNGSPVPEFVFIADYYPGTDWRGVPFAPGKSFYDASVLQDRWGTSDAPTRDVFIGHLAVGSYEIAARFVSRLYSNPHETLRTEAEVVRFDVRARAPAEDSSFREFERVRRMAWDLTQRPRYLTQVLALVEARVASNRADPYLPFLLRNGLSTAWAIGQSPDDSTSRRIAQIRAIVAESQKDLPSGAVMVGALCSERPGLSAAFLELLRGSLAERLAANCSEHPDD
jgi:hypothetical protein